MQQAPVAVTRPPPQHYVMAGYTRNPMTSPSLVKKSPLHAAVDANKFSSVRVVRNVRGFIKVSRSGTPNDRERAR